MLQGFLAFFSLLEERLSSVPPVGFTLSLVFNVCRAKAKKGERLLVHGASGDMGLVAVQLGRELDWLTSFLIKVFWHTVCITVELCAQSGIKY